MSKNYMTPMEWIMKNRPDWIFESLVPQKKRGWSALHPDGTGKFTGINLTKLQAKLRRTADLADSLKEAKEDIDRAIKDNPLHNGLPF
jgi:hypothetical protein